MPLSQQSDKVKKLPDRKKLHSLYRHNRGDYDTQLRGVYRRIQNLLIRNKINANLKQRVKSFDSYFEKILRAITHGQTPEINDMFGIRVICPFVEDLSQAFYLIYENFSVIELDRKGEKQSFREFGYDSIHIQIALPSGSLPKLTPYVNPTVEVQLRTILQEAWAEVEHEIVYKADYSLLKAPIKRKLASLNAMLTLSDTLFQEIRDSQKEIEQRNGMRRHSLIEKIEDIDSHLNLLSNIEAPEEEEDLKKTKSGNGHLENLLIKALNAHSRGEFDKAIRMYSHALRMNPDANVRSILYNHRGMARFVKSDYKRAIADFSKALEYNPENYRALNHRGLCYRMSEQYERALQDFDASLTFNSAQPDTYYIRALVYYDLRDYTCALEDCKRVLNLKPDFVSAQRLKSIIGAKFRL